MQLPQALLQSMNALAGAMTDALDKLKGQLSEEAGLQSRLENRLSVALPSIASSLAAIIRYTWAQ